MIRDVVVDTVGYRWAGTVANTGRFSYGEQIQLSGGGALIGTLVWGWMAIAAIF